MHGKSIHKNCGVYSNISHGRHNSSPATSRMLITCILITFHQWKLEEVIQMEGSYELHWQWKHIYPSRFNFHHNSLF